MIGRALRTQDERNRSPSWLPVSSSLRKLLRLLTEGVEHYKEIDAYDCECTTARQGVSLLYRINGLIDSNVN